MAMLNNQRVNRQTKYGPFEKIAMLQYQRVNDRVVQANFRNPETGMWAISCEHGKRTEQTTCSVSILINNRYLPEPSKDWVEDKWAQRDIVKKHTWYALIHHFVVLFNCMPWMSLADFPTTESSFQIDLLERADDACRFLQCSGWCWCCWSIRHQELKTLTRNGPAKQCFFQLISNLKMESTIQNPGLLLSSWGELVFLVFLTGGGPETMAFKLYELWSCCLVVSKA